MATHVADAIEPSWESEDIPDDDLLFMRVHRNLLSADGAPEAGAFRDHGSGMSTDWAKYSTPRDTLARANDPSANAVIAMRVADIRGIPGQIVKHTPTSKNRAHTDVIGEKKKDAEVRLKFQRLSRVVIQCSG